VDDFLDFAIVRLQVFFQFIDPLGEFLICSQRLAQADKGAHHEDAHFDCLFRVEHCRRHDCAMFGEGIRQKSPAATPDV